MRRRSSRLSGGRTKSEPFQPTDNEDDNSSTATSASTLKARQLHHIDASVYHDPFPSFDSYDNTQPHEDDPTAAIAAFMAPTSSFASSTMRPSQSAFSHPPRPPSPTSSVSSRSSHVSMNSRISTSRARDSLHLTRPKRASSETSSASADPPTTSGSGSGRGNGRGKRKASSDDHEGEDDPVGAEEKKKKRKLIPTSVYEIAMLLLSCEIESVYNRGG